MRCTMHVDVRDYAYKYHEIGIVFCVGAGEGYGRDGDEDGDGDGDATGRGCGHM